VEGHGRDLEIQSQNVPGRAEETRNLKIQDTPGEIWTRYRMIKRSKELERTWKEEEVVYLRYCIDTCLKELRWTTKRLSHNSWSPGRDINSGPLVTSHSTVTSACADTVFLHRWGNSMVREKAQASLQFHMLSGGQDGPNFCETLRVITTTRKYFKYARNLKIIYFLSCKNIICICCCNS
jgi:hypothetical protein